LSPVISGSLRDASPHFSTIRRTAIPRGRKFGVTLVRPWESASVGRYHRRRVSHALLAGDGANGRGNSRRDLSAYDRRQRSHIGCGRSGDRPDDPESRPVSAAAPRARCKIGPRAQGPPSSQLRSASLIRRGGPGIVCAGDGLGPTMGTAPGGAELRRRHLPPRRSSLFHNSAHG
jgi:hypothetical protein